MQSLDDFAAQKLAELERDSLRRVLVETDRLDGIWALRNGRRLLSFCCNDYLNLTHHPAIKEAAIAALTRYGVGSGGSRLVTGNHPLFAELEGRLARMKGAQAACVFGSGYLANTGIIPALIGAADLVLIDELAHACLWAGARLARATVVPFRHSDLAHLEALLTEHRGRHKRALIATDGVFSMDGDLAPCPSWPPWRNGSTPGCCRTTPTASASSAADAARLSRTAAKRTSRCRWARCRRRSAPMAAISAPPPR